MSLVNRGLILTTISFTFEYLIPRENTADCIHEQQDKDIFDVSEDGIGYVISNFTSIYHPKWAHLDKEVIQQKKLEAKKTGTKRGRKPKAPVVKKSGNKHFMSSITFGVVSPADPERIHGIKMFRKNHGNIANLKYEDSEEYITAVVDKLFRYIEFHKPGLKITYTGSKRELSNNSVKYENMNGRVLNTFKLSEILMRSEYRNSYWGCLDNPTIMISNQTELTLTCHHAFYQNIVKGKPKNIIYKCKINYKGELYVFGGDDREIIEKYIRLFWALIEKNEDVLLGIGYPTL